ncbi:hypothetical protein ACFYT4_28520 [Streptomyces sp. NPDC004609]|uniref:hypothetical protein n=1 Tax=Streptomyces sp. NPDC004609 TaxID=3364704 RepID=UPI00368F555C
MLHAAVLWTIRHLDAAGATLRVLPADQREHDVLDEDVARLSPRKHADLNVLGRYSFRGSTPVGGGCFGPCSTRPRSKRRRTRPPRG